MRRFYLFLSKFSECLHLPIVSSKAKIIKSSTTSLCFQELDFSGESYYNYFSELKNAIMNDVKSKSGSNKDGDFSGVINQLNATYAAHASQLEDLYFELVDVKGRVVN